jgi:uncharacterized membrane protein
MAPNASASSLCLSTHTPTSNERIAAAIAHGGTCVAWFLAPLVVFLVERDRSSFVARHALQALLWSALGTVVSAATCGLAIPLFLIVHVYAAFQALDGKEFDLPLVSTAADSLLRRG